MTRQRRRFVAAAVVVAAGVALLALVAFLSPTRAGLLDPDSFEKDGGRALARVLAKHGVDIDVVRSIDEAVDAANNAPKGTTLFVSDGTFFGPTAASKLVPAATSVDRIVLSGVTDSSLEAFDLPVTDVVAVSDFEHTVIPSACDNAIVRRNEHLTGTLPVPYEVDTATTRPYSECFKSWDTVPDQGGRMSPLLIFGADPKAATTPSETVLLGAPQVWSNANITKKAHAAIALRALGKNPHLIWYQPAAADLAPDTAAGNRPPSAWPTWLRPGMALLAAATVLFLIASGRRLGRLVTEPLPVLVPATETTLSRGAMYRKARARAHAAAALRGATLRCLRTRLRLAQDPLERVVAEVARASAYDPAVVQSLLTGSAPASDQDLLQLSRDLQDLEEKVRAHD